MAERRFTERGEELLRRARGRGDVRSEENPYEDAERRTGDVPADVPRDASAESAHDHPATPAEPVSAPVSEAGTHQAHAAGTHYADEQAQAPGPAPTPTPTPTPAQQTGRRSPQPGGTASEEHLLPGGAAEDFQARWHEILAGFVDGPRHAVEEADQLLDQVATLINDGLEERRRALRGSWQGENETRTEELRVALQKYRGLVTHLLET